MSRDEIVIIIIHLILVRTNAEEEIWKERRRVNSYVLFNGEKMEVEPKRTEDKTEKFPHENCCLCFINFNLCRFWLCLYFLQCLRLLTAIAYVLHRKQQIMLYLYHVHNFSSCTPTKQWNYVYWNNSNPFLRFMIRMIAASEVVEDR